MFKLNWTSCKCPNCLSLWKEYENKIMYEQLYYRCKLLKMAKTPAIFGMLNSKKDEGHILPLDISRDNLYSKIEEKLKHNIKRIKKYIIKEYETNTNSEDKLLDLLERKINSDIKKIKDVAICLYLKKYFWSKVREEYKDIDKECLNKYVISWMIYYEHLIDSFVEGTKSYYDFSKF